MENQPAQPFITNPKPVVSPPEPPKKQKPWLIIGLVALVILFLGTTVYFAYQNQQLTKQHTNQPEPTVSVPSPAPTITTPTIEPTITTRIENPTSDSPPVLKTYTSTKLTENSLPSVTLQYYSDWMIVDKSDYVNSVNISFIKNGYEVNLYQAAFGGAVCLFDDSPDFEGPSTNYRSINYTEIQANFGTLRYFINPRIDHEYAFCQKRNEHYSSTEVGILKIIYPEQINSQTLHEAIEIIKSITIN